ncbi:hypothetical protein ACFY4B_27095 [Kitasatospora sp. NPDC001261]|uniref:hypothetical protein n=1 Tax=Kitasatospora sp. NPDC001261 TaxID=3364012 RepID=UPI003694F6B0
MTSDRDLVSARVISPDHFVGGETVYVLGSPAEVSAFSGVASPLLEVTGERGRHVTGETGLWLAGAAGRQLASARYLIHHVPGCDACAGFRRDLVAEIAGSDWGDTPPDQVMLYGRLDDQLVHIADALRLGLA